MAKVSPNNKSPRIKKFLYALASLAALMDTPKAFAQLPPTAFKNFSKHYKKKEYDLVLGAAALESGFIHNLRFFGNFIPGQSPEGNRDYIKDRSQDPLWNLTKLLFPSPAGQLTIERALETNFGKNATPKTIALLQNFAHSLRQGKAPPDEAIIENILASFNKDFKSLEKQELTALKQSLKNLKPPQKNGTITKEIADLFKMSQVARATWKNINPSIIETLNEKDKPFEEKQEAILSALKTYLAEKEAAEIKIKKAPYEKEIKEIVTYLKNAIGQEGSSLYPARMAEQILSAFFDKKFNTQKDIRDFMENLDDTIVDKTHLPKEDDYLTAEDLPIIASKTEPYELDEIYDLTEAGLFTAITPYKAGISLLSNGNTYPYDRQTDKLLTTRQPFSDCFEMAARHLMNLTLYNPLTKEFDLGALKKTIKGDNPYFKNFEAFYSFQKPQDANNGDIQMRSVWNKVVGDLNAFGGIPIRYCKDNKYDLDPGFINLVRVFEKLFGLSLGDLTTPDLEGKKRWVEESLGTLLKTLNPTRTYQFNTTQLTESGEDISGTFGITVRDERRKDLFSFDLYAKSGMHSEVKNLTNFISSLKSYQDCLITHPSVVQEGAITEAIWLSNNKDGKDIKLISPLYQLFGRPLTDNDTKIVFLKNVNKRYQEFENNFLNTSLKYDCFEKILKNVLADFSWEDSIIVEKVSPIIISLMEIQAFRNILNNTVKGFYLKCFSVLEERSLEALRSSVKVLFVAPDIIDLSKTPPFLGVTTLSLQGSRVQKLDVALLKNLKKLNLWGTEDLKILILDNPTLEDLDLSWSGVSTLEGFSTAKNLKKLNLRDTRSLQTLTLGNPALEELDLSTSSISKLEGLSTAKHLKKLNLRGARSFQILTLDSPALEELDLSTSSISKLEGLSTAKNLKKLNLRGTRSFRTLILDNPVLEEVDLSTSSVSKLEGLSTAKNLKNLYLGSAEALTTLILENPSLEGLYLSRSGVSILKGLSTAKNLKKLYLANMQAFKTLTLENPSLEVVYLSWSGVSTLEGLSTAKNLKKLNLWGTGALKTLTLENPSLEELDLSWSGISTLEGFSTAKNLKKLDLKNTKYLQEIVFKEDNKDLVIDLRGSGIKSKNQIRGFDRLDETKITWGFALY